MANAPSALVEEQIKNKLHRVRREHGLNLTKERLLVCWGENRCCDGLYKRTFMYRGLGLSNTLGPVLDQHHYRFFLLGCEVAYVRVIIFAS